LWGDSRFQPCMQEGPPHSVTGAEHPVPSLPVILAGTLEKLAAHTTRVAALRLPQGADWHPPCIAAGHAARGSVMPVPCPWVAVVAAQAAAPPGAPWDVSAPVPGCRCLLATQQAGPPPSQQAPAVLAAHTQAQLAPPASAEGRAPRLPPLFGTNGGKAPPRP
jgi:hypothetical protein